MKINCVKRSVLLLAVLAVLFYFGGYGEVIGFGQRVMAYPTYGIPALSVDNQGITVVVDSGHGGSDPGKVGLHGEKEKEINLSIAKKHSEKS